MFSSSFSVVLDHCLLLKEPSHLLSLLSSSDPDFLKNLSPVIDTRALFEAAVRVRADWCWASCGLDEESSCSGEGTRYYLCSNMAFLPPTGWLPHSDKSSPHSERTSDIQRHFCHHKTISEGENCKQGERFLFNLILFLKKIFHDFFFSLDLL